MMNARAGGLEASYGAVRNDVFKFCQALNFEPTWQQRQLLEIVQRRQPREQIACKSGKGPGKTTVSGIIGLWWAIQQYGTKIIVTAPTMRQCRDVWLAEVRRTLSNADPWLQRVFRVTSSKVVVGKDNPDWGVQTMTATSPEASQGFHHPNLKVIVEEASGVDRALIQALKDTQSNEDCAMLMIGNPNSRDSAFFDCFHKERARWKTLTFNAEETPASRWFDPKRNKAVEDEFGRDSDVYRVAVLGEFPHADPACVMSSEDLEKVCRRDRIVEASKRSRVKQFGLDFARFGGDELTVYRRSGEAIVQWTRLVRQEPSVLVDLAFRWQLEAGWRDDECHYVPDAGGMGQGVLSKFYAAHKQVLEFHSNGKAVESLKYADRITEAWFNLAAKVKKGVPALPDDNVLIQQLSTRQYSMTKNGRIKLESKDDYKKRGHDSPDRADGVVLAFYDRGIAREGAVI